MMWPYVSSSRSLVCVHACLFIGCESFPPNDPIISSLHKSNSYGRKCLYVIFISGLAPKESERPSGNGGALATYSGVVAHSGTDIKVAQNYSNTHGGEGMVANG